MSPVQNVLAGWLVEKATNEELIAALQECTPSALSPSLWAPPSCEGEEFTSCAHVVKVSFP